MIEKKICRICGIEKDITEFRLAKNNNKNFYENSKNLFYRTECKECEKIKFKEYYKKTREKRLAYKKKYRENHTEERSNYWKNYYNEHKKELYNNRKLWAKKTGYYKKYREYNRDKINIRQKERLKNDYIFKLKRQTRAMIKASFYRRYYLKKDKTEKILGINIEDFIAYLLNTFKENYGYEWNKEEPIHIDHIIPLATANTEEEIIKLCHYTNLQLLKAKDNLRKSAKLDCKDKLLK